MKLKQTLIIFFISLGCAHKLNTHRIPQHKQSSCFQLSKDFVSLSDMPNLNHIRMALTDVQSGKIDKILLIELLSKEEKFILKLDQQISLIQEKLLSGANISIKEKFLVLLSDDLQEQLQKEKTLKLLISNLKNNREVDSVALIEYLQILSVRDPQSFLLYNLLERVGFSVSDNDFNQWSLILKDTNSRFDNNQYEDLWQDFSADQEDEIKKILAILTMAVKQDEKKVRELFSQISGSCLI